MFLNKALLIGNLTRDPELKALPSGMKVCNIGLATNRSYKDKDGNRQEVVEYHNIVAFGKLGELAAQYLRKGSQAYVEGRLQTRSWDAPDGGKRYRTEIFADNIQFGWKAAGSNTAKDAAGKGDGASVSPDAAAPMPSESIDYPKEDINPDDIPF